MTEPSGTHLSKYLALAQTLLYSLSPRGLSSMMASGQPVFWHGSPRLQRCMYPEGTPSGNSIALSEPALEVRQHHFHWILSTIRKSLRPVHSNQWEGNKLHFLLEMVSKNLQICFKTTIPRKVISHFFRLNFLLLPKDANMTSPGQSLFTWKDTFWSTDSTYLIHKIIKLECISDNL